MIRQKGRISNGAGTHVASATSGKLLPIAIFSFAEENRRKYASISISECCKFIATKSQSERRRSGPLPPPSALLLPRHSRTLSD